MPRPRTRRRQLRLRLRSLMATAMLRALGPLPLGVNRRIGATLGRISWLLANSQAKITSYRNIHRCWPELHAREQRALAKTSFIHTAMTATEVASVWHQDYAAFKRYVKQIHNAELVDAARQRGRGLLLLVPHLGNWEVFGQIAPQLVDITFMFQPSEMPELDNLMRRARSKEGVKLAPTNRQGVSQLLKVLKAGEAVGILPDQVPDSGGRVAPFFDQPALTMTLVHKLTQRTGAEVIMGFAQRVPDGFDIHFQKPDPDIYAGDADTSVAALNRSVEQCVRQVPEQYQWEYKRFKRVDGW